jgi:exonuclease III
MQWDAAFLNYLKNLDSKKPVIWCGDLNVSSFNLLYLFFEQSIKGTKPNQTKTKQHNTKQNKGINSDV